MKRVLMGLVLGVLFLGACGDDGGSGGGLSSSEDKAAAERVAASIKSDPDSPEVTDEQADCLGTQIVKKLGAKRVNELDLEADDPGFTDTEVPKAVDAYAACVDLKQLLVDAFTSEMPISEKSRSCVEGELSDKDARAFLEAAFNSSSSEDSMTGFVQQVTGIFSTCLTPEEFAQLDS
jgi:hypothetical protein